MRKYFLAITLLCSTFVAAADNKWAMVTQRGETILMSNVGYILNSDGSQTFTLVLNDNSTVDDVTKVSFAKVSATGIGAAPTATESGVYAKVIDGSISVSDCNIGDKALICAPDGRLMKQSMLDDGNTVIDVSSFAPGVYLLRIGKTTVKFQKK